jgi:hypothetical protein
MKNRPVIKTGHWAYRKENLSKPSEPLFRWSAIYVDPPERLRRALDNPAHMVALIRCPALMRDKKQCGRVVGQVFKTIEGLIVLVYEKRPDEFAMDNRRINKGNKIPAEVFADPFFVDEVDKVNPGCCVSGHGSGFLDSREIEAAAKSPETKVLHFHVAQRNSL